VLVHGEETHAVQIDPPSGGPVPFDSLLVAANANGLFSGVVRPHDFGNLTDGIPCWIRFYDFYDEDDEPIGERGRLYGPAKFMGFAESEGETRAVYMTHVGEQEFLAKCSNNVAEGASGSFALYHKHDAIASGIVVQALCLAKKYKALKWAIVKRIGRELYATQWGC
jgi:hypothetical protein